MFETYSVGSLPRPRWVKDLIENRKSGSITPDEFDSVLDNAIPSAIKLQEYAGLDFVSDGEWRRESYIKVFSDSVFGFKSDLHVEESGVPVSKLPYPAVVDKIKSRIPIADKEALFLKQHTNRKTTIAIPSAYTIGRRMWIEEHSKKAYPTREEFISDCIPILRDEIALLEQIGVDSIQLDDPWLALLVDPSYRQRENIVNIENEIELSINSINSIVEKASIPISVHLCHAHFNRKHGTKGSYEPIMQALNAINANRFALELATPDAGTIKVLKEFPPDKTLGLGVVDHTNPEIETPEQILNRTLAAMEYVSPENITLNTDCGFSPSSQNPMDLDEAYLKLKAMCMGAEMLRNKYA